MFEPGYWKVLGYFDNEESAALCLKCAEKKFGLMGNKRDYLLGRANLTAIYAGESGEWDDGLTCEDCGEYIVEPSCQECGDKTLERDEENKPLCEKCEEKRKA